MKKNDLNEVMKISATHIGEINSLNLVDPRTDENCKIYYERSGSFISNGKVYKGSYLVYDTPNMARAYAGVFVAENLDESDDGINPVTLVAIDPIRRHVVGRTRYRARVSERKCDEMFKEGK